MPLVFSGGLDLDCAKQKHPYNNLEAALGQCYIGSGGLELLNEMLTYDPRKRITVCDHTIIFE